MKKMVSLLLVLAMCLSLTATSFAAYNDHTDYVDWPLVKDGEQMTVKVTAIRHPSFGVDPEEQWFWVWSEKFSGIDFDVEQVLSTSWGEKKSLMFASGEMPDLLFGLSLSPEDLVRYGMGESQLLDLTPYVTPEIMPNLCKWIEAYPEMKSICTTPDGKMYTLPGVTDLHYVGTGVYMMEINQEWLKEAGLENPKTLDEFTAMLYKFKEMRPDCIPLCGGSVGGSSDPRYYIMNAMGYTTPDIGGFADSRGARPAIRNGECVIPAYDDDFVEVLRLMNEYYTNGLISPDFFTIDDTARKAQIAEDMCGAYQGPAHYALPEAKDFSKWVVVTPATSKWNDTPKVGQLKKFGCGYVSLSSAIDPSKIETVMKYLDAFYTDLLGMYLYCGPSATSSDCIGMLGGYRTDENGAAEWLDVDGNVINNSIVMGGQSAYISTGFGNRSNPLDPELLEKGVNSRPVMRTYYYDADKVVPYKPDPNFGAQFLVECMTENVEPYRIDSYPMYTYFDEETTLAIQELQTVLHAYMESEEAKFITGVRSLDEFPKYQEELKQMGVEELLGYYREAYAKYGKAE